MNRVAAAVTSYSDIARHGVPSGATLFLLDPFRRLALRDSIFNCARQTQLTSFERVERESERESERTAKDVDLKNNIKKRAKRAKVTFVRRRRYSPKLIRPGWIDG